MLSGKDLLWIEPDLLALRSYDVLIFQRLVAFWRQCMPVGDKDQRVGIGCSYKQVEFEAIASSPKAIHFGAFGLAEMKRIVGGYTRRLGHIDGE